MRILIVKLSALGDVVQTFDTVAYLRTRFPDAVIDWLVKDGIVPLLLRHKALSRAIPLSTPAHKTPYDLLFDLQGNIKSAYHGLRYKAKRRIGFSYKDLSEWPNLLVPCERYSLPPNQNIKLDYLHLAKAALHDKTPHTFTPHSLITTEEEEREASALRGDFTTLVTPGSRWKNKQLLPGTIDPKNKLFLAGNAEERELAARFGAEKIIPALPFGVLIALLKQMELVIGADSFPLHLAGALGIPTKAHFGPSLAEKYAPFGCKTSQGICPYNIQFKKRCSYLRSCKTGACMKQPTL